MIHRNGGGLVHVAPQAKKMKIEPQFVGMTEPPTACPRERCGQPVTIHGTADPDAPITWSCVVGHGGVVNATPVLRQSPNTIPKWMCQRCAKAPVPEKRKRGGLRGRYCDACVDEGRRLFAEEVTR